MSDKNYCPDCEAFLPGESHKPMCTSVHAELIAACKAALTRLFADEIVETSERRVGGSTKVCNQLRAAIARAESQAGI